MTSPRKVVVEADGGSRGNPGPAAYGALLRDPATGDVLVEDGDVLGTATNNVAEYAGLLAGLRLVRDHAPGAEVEVRMDSKLVVEQMAGRWKIKNAELRAMADEARGLVPPGTVWTWVPREQNGHADRLANDALDGVAVGVRVRGEAVPRVEHLPGSGDADSAVEEAERPASQAAARGWSVPAGPPTTLVLVRHGVTVHTAGKKFSGGLGGDNPPLSEEGRAQVLATARWLAPRAGEVDVVVASPVRRTRESAEILAAELEAPLVEEPGFAEMEFGSWDGLSFGEVHEQHPEELSAWLGSLDVPAGGAGTGGESFRAVEERVLAGLQRVLDEHAGRTVVVASHVTPIKTLVSHAVGAPLGAVFRMELSPASVTVVSFFAGGPDGTEPQGSLRLYNALPTDDTGPSLVPGLR